MVVGAARAYREAMRDFATKTELEVWYARVDVDDFMGEYVSQLEQDAGQADAVHDRQGAHATTTCSRSAS